MSTEGGDGEVDIGLSAEEQAQFDSMRDSVAPGSNASRPEHLVQAEPEVQPDGGTPAPDRVKAEVIAPQGEPSSDEDPDVETIKDAAGKDVIDAKTGKPQKRVSFHKFQRTANELAEARKQLATTAEERARIDERLKIINEALMTPETPAAEQKDEDPEPDAENNIFEWVKWSKREMDRRTERFQSFVNETQAEREEAQVANAYRNDAAKFASTEPHFGQAYSFLMQNRAAQLRSAGWSDEDQISRQLVKEEKGLVRKALQDKASPAKRIFDMATAIGFKPAAAPPAPKPADPPVPGTPLNGSAPQVPAVVNGAANGAARPSGVPSVSEQVALAAQGVDASKTLSTSGGAALEQLTQAKLLTMDEDEFAAVVANLSKTKLRELFGD